MLPFQMLDMSYVITLFGRNIQLSKYNHNNKHNNVKFELFETANQLYWWVNRN